MLVVPHLILRQGDKILLTKRAMTKKFWPGYWHCVTGTIESGESPRAAIIREAYEEIGVTLKDPELVATIHVNEIDSLHTSKGYYGTELFFLSDLPDDQTPVNMEPDKQDDMRWFDLRNYPTPIIPGVKFGIELFLQGLRYGEYKS